VLTPFSVVAIVTSTTTQQLIKEKFMTNLTTTINEISSVLGMGAMDLYESISMNNMLNDHDKIETEDEIRIHLVEVAFFSRMSVNGQENYSKVCEITDNYFKTLLAA
jgi:hypothetical protein